MAWGSLIKTGMAIGASAIASEKLAEAMTGAVERSAEAINRAAARAAGEEIGNEQAAEGTDARASSASKRSVTAKCIGCHAPMAGAPGVRYRCPYCDTIQTLD